ncbi:MAG: GAF domain-containing sensor histidine kinase [Chloroflexaceae bacterium]|nr:GAF domain-containing sensor histidine kinase [Chloroflexaceae bacterium]
MQATSFSHSNSNPPDLRLLVAQQARQIAMLTELAHIAATPQAEAALLTAAAQCLATTGGYTTIEIFLLDPISSELVLAAVVGAEQQTGGYRQSVQHGILGQAIRTGQVQRVDDVQQAPAYLAGYASTCSELCVPISARGTLLGVLNLESPDRACFALNDVSLLTAVADLLAGMIEQTRLAQRAQEAAVLRERNRLARELHDSVTQQLFSITLTAQAARTHLERNPQRVEPLLERLQETASAALTEMRALISQLRPPALAEQGLVTALRQLVAQISHREGLRIDLRVSGDERLTQGFEAALYRIVQEALNNIVKHANAGCVQIVLDCQPQHVALTVADDGQGFELEALPPVHTSPPSGFRQLGLLTMHERASELGGSLRLHSQVGQGTSLTLLIPRSPQE